MGGKEFMRRNPNNHKPNIIISGYEITLGFNHTKEPNHIPETVRQMLLSPELQPCHRLPVVQEMEEESDEQLMKMKLR